MHYIIVTAQIITGEPCTIGLLCFCPFWQGILTLAAVQISTKHFALLFICISVLLAKGSSFVLTQQTLYSIMLLLLVDLCVCVCVCMCARVCVSEFESA